VVHWIKIDLDVPDGSIPLRLSDLLGSLDHDRTVGIKGERAHRARLGFRGGTPARRAGGGLQLRCSRFWMTTRLRRIAGGRDDLVHLICVLDCAQTREGGAAGDRLWRKQASGGKEELNSL
jgi:hypothetical protein